MEELEAVDWYQQRMDATENDELRASCAQPGRGAGARRDGARVDPPARRWMGSAVRDYLFREGSIVAREGAMEQGNGDGEKVNGTSSTGASIGSLRARR